MIGEEYCSEMAIYLDSAATTRPSAACIAAMTDAMQNHFGNPSSLHSVGLDAQLVMDHARRQIAAALGCAPDALLFTSGATESNHLAIRGAAAAYGRRKRRVITTAVEHACVRGAFDLLEAEGYEHYEISNFARPGCRSRHNSSYWQGAPYIGIGAAAHSYDIKTRSWNIADICQYIKGMEQGQRLFESETINEDTRYNDAVTVALRTCEGLDLSKLTPKQRTYCLANAQRHMDAHLLRLQDCHLSLTKEGLFVSDMVMSDLILV